MTINNHQEHQEPRKLKSLERSTIETFTLLIGEFYSNFGFRSPIRLDTVETYFKALCKYPELFIMDVMDEFIQRENVTRLPSTSEFIHRLETKCRTHESNYNSWYKAKHPEPVTNWDLGTELLRKASRLIRAGHIGQLKTMTHSVCEKHGVPFK